MTRRLIHAYDAIGDGTRLVNKREMADAELSAPEGLRYIMAVDLLVGWGTGPKGLDGVSVFHPGGTLMGRISLPERYANLCFGGTHRNGRFMVGRKSAYAIYVNIQSAIGG